MTHLAIIAICIILLVLAFLLPRLSIWPQRGVDQTLGAGQRTGGKAPGPLGKLFSKCSGPRGRPPTRAPPRVASARGKMPL